jgi:hypothetical protein
MTVYSEDIGNTFAEGILDRLDPDDFVLEVAEIVLH